MGADRTKRSRFIWAMACEFARNGVKTGAEAPAYARDTYHSYLAEIGVPFGHADYDWSPAAGAEVAHLMEIDYWEPRP